MKHWIRYSVLFLFLLLACACTTVSATPSNNSALDPHGFAAAKLASLWWIMFALGTAIFVLVLGLLVAGYLRRQRATDKTPPESRDGDLGRAWLIRGGIALPVIVLGVVFGYTMNTLASVENTQAKAGLHIQVTAKRWWWSFQYADPGKNVTTANEVHIPVGVPVQFQLESPDVIHSFWVPELHGKMDVIPGHTNYLTLQADQPGVYRGECAEYCGLQHANMGFIVVAQSQVDFDHWLAGQQQPAKAPADSATKQGQQVFISAGCIYCHTVRGLDTKGIVSASTNLGPDLTHLASRSTIAGATLANNTNNLAGWVVNAQHIKQGVDMSNMTVSAQDLQMLLAYLQSLK